MNDWTPLWLSLRVAGVALLFVGPLGALVGYLQSRARYRLAPLVDAALLLPLVLPPSVTGYYLLVLLGRHGVLGAPLHDWLGVTLVFSFPGAVLAASVVAFPLMAKTAQAAFAGVDAELEEVAYTLGLSRVETFLRVTLPQAQSGLVAAASLAFARAIGEFGATLLFAGAIPGRTATASLEIFASLQSGDDARAGALTAALTGASLLVVLAASRFARDPRTGAA